VSDQATSAGWICNDSAQCRSLTRSQIGLTEKELASLAVHHLKERIAIGHHDEFRNTP
jgi:hypothetical protein